MNLAARTIIAELPATDPATGKDGKVIGFPAANAIADAFADAGYVVIPREELEKLRIGMESVLAMLSQRK